MKSKTDTNKIIIYTVCGLFVLGAVFCFFSYVYASIESVSVGNLNEKFEEYEAEKQKAMEIEKTYHNWMNIEKIIGKFNREYFFTMDEFGKFRQKLQMTLGKNRLAMTKAVSHTFRHNRYYIRAEMKFNAQGKYQDIKRFIIEIKNLKKIVVIKRVSFNRKSASQISVQFNLEVYIVRKS